MGRNLRLFAQFLFVFLLSFIPSTAFASGRQIVYKIALEETAADKIARFATNPYIITLLLTIGCLGLMIQLFTHGFGLPGLVALTSFLLFFYGHIVSGLAGYETILLFVVGIVLLFLELFIPGGIVGILGGIAIVTSLFLAGRNIVQMGISILIAIGISILASIIMVKVLGKRMKFFKKMILTDTTNTESGYVSNQNRTDLVGKIGTTLTALRPAGTVVIKEERIDVVSEGIFIEKNTKVKVVKAEGARIVVREADTDIKGG